MLNNSNLTPKSLGRLMQLEQNKKLKPMVTFTFDDGYTSDYEIVKPIFDELGVRGTFFARSGAVDVEPTAMTSEQLREMVHSGQEIGSHTHGHIRLTDKSDEEIVTDLKESKKKLEEATGQPVTSLCYPFGATDDRVKNLVAGTFDGARTITNGGELSPYTGRQQYVNLYGRHNDFAIMTSDSDSKNLDSFKYDINALLDLEEPGWWTMMFHMVYKDGDSSKPNNRLYESEFRERVEFVVNLRNQGLLEIVTFKEGLRKIHNGKSIHL